MSEYQYYGFVALDRPLTDKQMEALRAISSRAEITSTHFSNVYHWGDLKAKPVDLMKRYFDAMVYVANWGTHRFMLRLPADLLDPDEAAAYCVDSYATMVKTGTHVVLDLWSETEEPDDCDDGSGWLGTLVQVRADLATGDRRALYLAWLRCIQDGGNDDATEPAVPPGMKDLPASLASLAEFLRIDRDLLAVAAAASPEPAVPSGNLAGWIADLPADEKDRLLLETAAGGGAPVAARLLALFRASTSRQAPAEPQRTVGSLLALAEEHRQTRRTEEARRQAAQRARREAEEARARAAYLDTLAGQQVALWEKAETLVASRAPRHYDQAVDLLVDLRDLAEHEKDPARFEERLAALIERHHGKGTFIERLRKAGLAGGGEQMREEPGLASRPEMLLGGRGRRSAVPRRT